MRIIGGKFKGRTLKAPEGDTTRPTSQRARQVIFDHLMHAAWYGRERLEEAVVLDCFAGTGALGLEALSRGAKSASFIEKSRSASAMLRHNIKTCSVTEQTDIFQCDVTRPGSSPRQHNLIFLDPPYGKNLVPLALSALSQKGWLAPGALIIAESEHQNHDVTDDHALLLKRHIGVAELRFWFL